MPKPVRRSNKATFQLFNRDCLEVLPTLPKGCVDLVVADPPYGTTACKWDSVIPLDRLWAAIKHVLRPFGTVVMTATQPFTTELIMSNREMFKYCLVWDKCNGCGFLDAKFRQIKVHEDVVVWSEGGSSNISRNPMTYNPQMGVGKPYKTKRAGTTMGLSASASLLKREDGDYGAERYPTTLLKITKENGMHPTQKPLALMSYLVKTYSNPGDMVLDFCMGSGTTGAACGINGRNFIGCESDTEHGYYKTAESRITKAYAESFVGTEVMDGVGEDLLEN